MGGLNIVFKMHFGIVFGGIFKCSPNLNPKDIGDGEEETAGSQPVCYSADQRILLSLCSSSWSHLQFCILTHHRNLPDDFSLSMPFQFILLLPVHKDLWLICLMKKGNLLFSNNLMQI